MARKDNYIQIRIPTATKYKFLQLLEKSGENMSSALCKAINETVEEFTENTQLCMTKNQPLNKPNVFYNITNFEDSPELKKLLLEYEYGMNEEHHCVTDYCLLCLYCQLLQNNQLHMLFEWNAFNNSIINGFNDDDDTEVGVII
jgi:hypothetical protein